MTSRSSGYETSSEKFLYSGPILVVYCAIITWNHLPFSKILSNFVHFCPDFQIFCPFLPFLWKIACMPLLYRVAPVISYVLSNQVWWCNIKWFWVIPKITSANLWKLIHDIINYSISICLPESGKCGKEGKKLQKFEYLENKKSFFDEIKSVFCNLRRAIIWSKNKNLIKNSRYKL